MNITHVWRLETKNRLYEDYMYRDYKWKISGDTSPLCVYSNLNCYWAFSEPLKHTQSNCLLSSRALVYKKIQSFFSWKIPFELNCLQRPWSSLSTQPCSAYKSTTDDQETRPHKALKKSFNSSCSKFLETNRKNYSWAQNKLNCNHTVMSNFSIPLHQEWLAYENIQCCKKQTNKVASFPKPCRTVCKKELPQIEEHGGIMS